MAKLECEDGVVELGTATVAEVRSISWSEETTSKEAFSMGDTRPVRRYRPGLIAGSMGYYWDPTDTNGQVAIAANGTASSFIVYPNGKVVGQPKITFGTIHWGSDSKTGEAEGWWEREVEFSAEAITEGTYTT